MQTYTNTASRKNQLSGIDIRGIDRQEWLELRRGGIGGSDAAALMGASKWATPLTVWLDKTGQVGEKPDSEAMRQGRDFEDVVARRFSEESGLKVSHVNRILIHPEHDWMRANIDRRVYGTGDGFVGLECKTTSVYNPTDIRGGEIPATYYWQCQHYMAVTGAPYWYLAILVLSERFVWHKVQRNDADIDELIRTEERFWTENVLGGMMPEPTGQEGDSAAITALQGAYRTDSAADLTMLKADIDALQELKAQQDELKRQREMLEQRIKLAMGASTKGHSGRWLIEYKDSSRTTVDSKRLKTELPDIYTMYSKTSAARTLSIKEDKFNV